MFIETDGRGSDRKYLLAEDVKTPEGEVRRQTLADLSSLPEPVIEGLRLLLGGDGLAIQTDRRRLQVYDRRVHGGVAAALTTIRRSDLPRELNPQLSGSRWRRVLAMVIWRLLYPDSQRSVAEELGPDGSTTLRPLLGLAPMSGKAGLKGALKWLVDRQPSIVRRTASRYLRDGCLLLYDLRDIDASEANGAWAGNGHAPGDPPMRRAMSGYGLLCAAGGHPVAIEALPDDGAAPGGKALMQWMRKWHRSFGERTVVLVGDRGWVPQILEDRERTPPELGWITAVGTPSVTQLAEQGADLPHPFGPDDLVRASSPDCPDERLIVFRSSLLAERQQAAQAAALARTERLLHELAESYADGYMDVERLVERVEQVHQQWQMGEHFEQEFDGKTGAFRFARRAVPESPHDGLFVVRTNLPADELDDLSVTIAYRRVAEVERAFGGWHEGHPAWPLLEHSEDRARAHLLVCMLAYRVELEMRHALAPMLTGDEAVPYGSGPAVTAEGTCPTNGGPPASFRAVLATLDRVTIGRIYPSEPRPDIKLAATDPLENGLSRTFHLLGCRPYGKTMLEEVFSDPDAAGEPGEESPSDTQP